LRAQREVCGSQRRELSLDGFDQVLIDVVGNEHPETLEEAVKLVRLRFPETEEAVVKRVLRLESEGKILFEKPPILFPSSFLVWFGFVVLGCFWLRSSCNGHGFFGS